MNCLLVFSVSSPESNFTTTQGVRNMAPRVCGIHGGQTKSDIWRIGHCNYVCKESFLSIPQCIVVLENRLVCQAFQDVQEVSYSAQSISALSNKKSET